MGSKRQEQAPPDKLVVAGKVTTVHGVRGWIKIHSYTVPESNIFDYQPWWMKFTDGWKVLEFDEYRTVNKGYIAHIHGVDDREAARVYCQREIHVSPDNFPPAAEDEFYWHELEGMQVVSLWQGKSVVLGQVDGFLETGANDVMIVKGAAGSIDKRERLIPYDETYVLDVDGEAGVIQVNWDPDFDVQVD